MSRDAHPVPPTPRLLSGGNPQIPKGHGAAPVEAYLAAMPGWKQATGRALHAAVLRTVPGVVMAVKWNSPLYGRDDDGWFLGVHCLTRYVKVAFFRGAALDPPLPVGSRQPEVRYLHLHEGDPVDARVEDWIRQASRLPGVRL